MRDLRRQLLRLYRQDDSGYPWRDGPDKYGLLMAELMLRRTQAVQVLCVYGRFMKAYPGIGVLAGASPGDVQEVLTPLGLERRGGELIALALQVQEEFGGIIPETREELKRLPGVGDYAAGMVLSVVLGRPEWAVDSGVGRLLSRYAGMAPVAEPHREAAVTALARAYIDGSKNPGRANLALVDHARIVCRPRPLCEGCHLQRCAWRDGVQ